MVRAKDNNFRGKFVSLNRNILVALAFSVKVQNFETKISHYLYLYWIEQWKRRFISRMRSSTSSQPAVKLILDDLLQRK